MKKIILIFTLLSIFFAWSCNDGVSTPEEWSSSARAWEEKVGYYRGQLEARVDGLPMDTVVQQVALNGDDYDRINLSISNIAINNQTYGAFYFSELSFKEENGVIYVKGKENNQNGALGLVSLTIDGEIKNDVFTFELTINGTNSLEIKLNMENGYLVEKFPSSDSSIEGLELDDTPFIIGVPSISGNSITFFVADSLTTTDSTFFSVKIKSLELAPGAWIEPDTMMNWSITHFDKDSPSTATTDSSYRFSGGYEFEDRYKRIRVWAADSIRWQYYSIGYAKSNAIDIPLFQWKDNANGYQEPIANWASNNAYIHQLLTSNTIKNPSMYVKRVLGNNIGDTGAEMRTEVIGTVADSNIRIVTGRLFRGEFDLDSIDTPKNGELHGIDFNKQEPMALRGYYKYLPGKVLYVGDSIVPDSVLNQTDSCYIETFLYETIDSDSFLDSLDRQDPRIIGYTRFAAGKTTYYRQFTMSIDPKNWTPDKTYRLGIVCRSSGKDDERIGSPGSVLSVSGFELMYTMD